MQFHRIHGKSIDLSQDDTCVKRTQSFNYGIVFGKVPITVEEKVTVEITETISEWSGGLRYGFTNIDPDTHDAEKLPPYAIPNLSREPQYYCVALNEADAKTGNRLSFYFTSQCTCISLVNNKPSTEKKMDKIDVSKPVWFVMDVYGCTKGIKLVMSDSEAAPIEIFVRGREAMEAFLVASRKGTKPVYRTRLMLVGQDRVGKTSLKRSLTGRRHDAKEVSTDGIDTADICKITSKDSKPWKVYAATNEDDQETKTSSDVPSAEDEFARAIAHNIVQELWNKRLRKKNDDNTQMSSQVINKQPNQNQNQTKEGKEESKISTMEESFTGQADARNKTKLVMNDITEQVKEAVGQELVDRVLTMVSEMLKKLESGQEVIEVSKTEQQEIMMSIWDFAGQSVYYTTHQVFLTTRAIYIIVFNLTHDLNSQAIVQVRRGEGHSNIEWKKSELTNIDFINFWINSIHTHTAESGASAPYDNNDPYNTTSLSPSVFLVGTHRASLSDDKETQWKIVKEKFKVIAESFRDKVYRGHFVGQFYAVENNIDDEEDEQVKLLRKHIVSIASKERYMGEHMPVSWLQFEQQVAEMIARGINFIPIDQGKDICSRFGIEEDLHSMLHFYHDLGVIIYYGQSGAVDESLRNTIILKPQWLIDVFKGVITTKDIDGQWERFAEAWHRLDKEGILEDSLINHMWCTIIAQKPTLIGLMSKFDLLCERIKPKTLKSTDKWEKSYFVPSRLKDSVDPNDVYEPSNKDIVFYITFGGFLPDGLFQRIMTRAVRWSQEQGGHEPKLYYRQARFYVDDEHDLILQMAPFRYACIKVIVSEVEILDDSDGSTHAGESSVEVLKVQERHQVACSKVRHFLEFTLSELRQLWIKRVKFTFSVACPCNKTCELHGKPGCKEESCRHFLSLDECLATNIITCDHRRIKTTKYKRWFPTDKPAPLSVPARAPISNEKDKEEQLPDWIKAAAKLLNAGPSGRDWKALAIMLGYKRVKVDNFSDEVNPAQELILDWIYSSGNTNLSVDMMLSYLEQMQREDVIEVIHKAEGSNAPPPSVFISYNWGIQDSVKQLRDRIERAGFSCWMDIGQMGGGDSLYAKIDSGMRNAKVILCCITPKYITSEVCNREVSLADLLKKPIIPIMFDAVPWPPPGGMGLAFARLLYVQMKGVGGHGGSGAQSDLELKYHDVINRIRIHCQPKQTDGIVNVNSTKSSDKTLSHDTISRNRGGRSVSSSDQSLQRQGRSTSAQLPRSGVRNCLVCAIL
ncbi:uncharacterized protein [Antedon mediterranea]|uniref:uncharacterized protein n=1 Tax=Antedon mediterranea TaxID=105859 RepID=UPI003AF4A763